MNSPIRKIGLHPGCQTIQYWLYSDGNVWTVEHGPRSNNGTLEEFMTRVAQGRVRFKPA